MKLENVIPYVCFDHQFKWISLFVGKEAIVYVGSARFTTMVFSQRSICQMGGTIIEPMYEKHDNKVDWNSMLG